MRSPGSVGGQETIQVEVVPGRFPAAMGIGLA